MQPGTYVAVGLLSRSVVECARATVLLCPTSDAHCCPGRATGMRRQATPPPFCSPIAGQTLGCGRHCFALAHVNAQDPCQTGPHQHPLVMCLGARGWFGRNGRLPQSASTPYKERPPLGHTMASEAKPLPWMPALDVGPMPLQGHSCGLGHPFAGLPLYCSAAALPLAAFQRGGGNRCQARAARVRWSRRRHIAVSGLDTAPHSRLPRSWARPSPRAGGQWWSAGRHRQTPTGLLA
jgi:hypothetical protein